MRASARESGPSPCLAAGAISPPLLCGSGFRLNFSRATDLKQNQQLGRRRCRPLESGIWTSTRPCRSASSARLRPIGRNRAPGPLPGANLVPPALFQVRDDGNGPVPGEL